MSLKAKLATTIAALCMVICLLTVGVWAASKTTVNMNGSVSFTANDVYATVAVATTGAETNITDKAVTFNCGNANTGVDNANTNTGATETWDDQDLKFSAKDATITITFTVTNHGERDLTVALTAEATGEGENLAVAVSEIADNKVEAGTEGTFSVTLNLVDTNVSLTDEGYTIALELTDVNA